MTKKELLKRMSSAKWDLMHIINTMEMRLSHNNVDEINEKHKDSEQKYAYQSGAFGAMVEMDNDAFNIMIKQLKKAIVELKTE